MADVKITELDAIASVAAADVIPIVDDVAGTPITKKATITQVSAAVSSVLGITTLGSALINDATTGDMYATLGITTVASALFDDTSTGAMQTTLGLGTIATQNANAVTVTGGNATLAGGTFTDIYTVDVHASGSGGVIMKNSGGTQVAVLGAANTTNVSFDGTVNIATIGTVTNAATSRTNLGLAIGTDVQAYDADILKADVSDNLTVGYTVTSYSAGTKSSGTYTPDPALGNFQYAVNGGAHTLAPPATDSNMVIQYTNNGSAGAITTSGFTKVTGSFTTTNGDDFLAYITRCNAFSHLNIVALQ